MYAEKPYQAIVCVGDRGGGRLPSLLPVTAFQQLVRWGGGGGG
jgi:hypothetical protein